MFTTYLYVPVKLHVTLASSSQPRGPSDPTLVQTGERKQTRYITTAFVWSQLMAATLPPPVLRRRNKSKKQPTLGHTLYPRSTL